MQPAAYRLASATKQSNMNNGRLSFDRLGAWRWEGILETGAISSELTTPQLSSIHPPQGSGLSAGKELRHI